MFSVNYTPSPKKESAETEDDGASSLSSDRLLTLGPSVSVSGLSLGRLLHRGNVDKQR